VCAPPCRRREKLGIGTTSADGGFSNTIDVERIMHMADVVAQALEEERVLPIEKELRELLAEKVDKLAQPEDDLDRWEGGGCSNGWERRQRRCYGTGAGVCTAWCACSQRRAGSLEPAAAAPAQNSSGAGAWESGAGRAN
jgi:hypothetical protein